MNCPACQNSKSTLLGNKNGFEIKRCSNCRSIYSPTPVMNYDEYYDENLSVPTFIDNRLKEVVESFGKFKENNRLLDIGFGAGNLMKAARLKNWQVSGVEVSKSAVRKAVGFNVFYGELKDASYPDNYFDVVTASEILEHCSEPKELIREVQRILRPNGLFWATTPNANGLSFKLLNLSWSVIAPPEHLQLFSKKGVEIMFEESGFKASIKTTGFNPSELMKVKNGASRTTSSYAINEKLVANSSGRGLKNILNFCLNLFSLGDSLKIRAVKN